MQAPIRLNCVPSSRSTTRCERGPGGSTVSKDLSSGRSNRMTRDYGEALNVRKLSSQEGGSESLCARTSRPGRSRCP